MGCRLSSFFLRKFLYYVLLQSWVKSLASVNLWQHLIFTACVAWKNQLRNWFLQAKNSVHWTAFFQLDFLIFKYRSRGERFNFKFHKWFQSETVRTLRVTAFSPDRLNNLSSALFFWRQVTTHRAVESNSTLVTGMFPKYRLTVWPI